MSAEDMEEEELVTPGEVLGKSTEVKPGSGAHSDPDNILVYASLTCRVRTVRPSAYSNDQKLLVSSSVLMLQVTEVMARMASADIMCVGPKSVREKFTGIISDARANYLSTSNNELGMLSVESTAGETMIPMSWTEMQCPLTGQVEKRKVAKDAFGSARLLLNKRFGGGTI